MDFLSLRVPKEESAQTDDADDGLEDLFTQKSNILSRKLDILAQEIWWRLRIGAQNMDSLDSEQSVVEEMLCKLDKAARYHIREHQEKGIFYRQLSSIETERRAQHVECWRDVAMVMRDFLYTWETQQHTLSRAAFMENVGKGT